MSSKKGLLKPPKINLYRNISVTFIVFTIMLLMAVFFFFYSQATIMVKASDQDINLSFNLAVKAKPTAEELAARDVVAGSMITRQKSEEGIFDVLSTKTVSSELVGQVKIINNSNRDQPLLKTSQLQAASGVIVRTNRAVTVPAGGNVIVEVYPADRSSFSDVPPGKLVIIKLNPSSQEKIYGTNESVLTASPREVKVLAESDLNRAKDELSKKIVQELRTELGLAEKDVLESEVVAAKTDKPVGAEADQFSLNLTIKGKALAFDTQQLADLIGRKVSDLDLVGAQARNIDISNLTYAIVSEEATGAVLAKINYAVKAVIDADNPIFNKENFVNKTIDEVKSYLGQYEFIHDVQVQLSPYWAKKLPKQAAKIKIFMQ